MNKKTFGTVISVFIIVFMIAVTIKLYFETKDYSNELNDYPSGLIEDLPSELRDNTLDYESGLEKNDIAPDFELITLTGETVRLSDYKGEKVILNFWASWCPPCRTEMPYMEKYYEEYGDSSNVEIIAVNMTKLERGKCEKIEEFVGKYKFTFPILLDKDGEVMNLYRVMVYSTTYIINTEGIITDKVMYSVDDK